MKRKGIYLIIIIVTAAVTFTTTYILNNVLENSDDTTISFSENIDKEKIKKFKKAQDILMRNYYKNIDENEILNYALSGMINSIDDYSMYFSKEDLNKHEDMYEESSKEYSGIGITIGLNTNNNLIVNKFLDGSPAKEAGMQIGDELLYVDNVNVKEVKDFNTVLDKMKGEENSIIKIKVLRPESNKEMLFNIKRKNLEYKYYLSGEVIDKNIGYIKIDFFDNHVLDNFNSELEKQLADGIKGLIIDVRNNSGGKAQGGAAIADRFLPKTLVLSYIERDGDRTITKNVYSEEKHLDLPVVVLINGETASASEILVAALKDYDRALIVGEKTLGKGLKQTMFAFDDGSAFKYSSSQYRTPLGENIHEKGIEPDIEVKNIDDSDKQLKKAIEEIKKMF